MKKTSRIYAYVWAMLFPAFIVSMFVSLLVTGSPSHRGLINLSESPEYIEKVLGVELPAVEVSRSDISYGNRYTSCTYKLTFREPLSEDHIAGLERQRTEDYEHWKKIHMNLYQYTEYVENGDEINCRIYNDHIDLECSISDGEDEIVDAMFYVIMTFAIIVTILIVWGIVMLIIAFVRKMKRVNQ